MFAGLPLFLYFIAMLFWMASKSFPCWEQRRAIVNLRCQKIYTWKHFNLVKGCCTLYLIKTLKKAVFVLGAPGFPLPTGSFLVTSLFFLLCRPLALGGLGYSPRGADHRPRLSHHTLGRGAILCPCFNTETFRGKAQLKYQLTTLAVLYDITKKCWSEVCGLRDVKIHAHKATHCHYSAQNLQSFPLCG